MGTPPIRTITLGVPEPHPLTKETVSQGAAVLRLAGEAFARLGAPVQTLRLSTRPMLSDLSSWKPDAVLGYAADLQGYVAEEKLAFCSLGPARIGTGPDRIDLLGEALAPHETLSAAVEVASPEHGVSDEAVRAAARVIQALAHRTAESFGNFRFGALALVPPGCPFFPAAYHDAPSATFSLGLQAASVVTNALGPGLSGQEITHRVREAVRNHAAPIVRAAQEFEREHGIAFGGVDLSPAPLGEDSIVAGLESCRHGEFGSSGTLSLVAAVTSGVRDSGLPTCGYNGLMLPVLEDGVLGQRWAQGRVDVQKILFYSAVCGTGLDMIPLHGDVSASALELIIADVATLAVRLRKPLSARLVPVVGTRIGDFTAFTSQYMTNTVVQ